MEVRREQALEAALPWFLLNVARLSAYLLAASIATGIFDASSIRGSDLSFLVEGSLIYFFGGGLICLPGTALWLLIVARLSPALPSRRRRTIAVAIAPPLIGVLWLLFFPELGVIPLAIVYGVLLPAGAGLVVRLRGFWRRSRFEEAF